MRDMMRSVSAKFCLALIGGLMIISSAAVAQKQEEMRFVQADSLMIVGKAFEQSFVKYGRLPKELEGEFRKELVSLGSNSSGLAIRFSTNSTAISARWKVTNNTSFNHMASTGIKGLDLYVLEGSKWMYVGTARPSGVESFSVFVKSMTRQNREYIAYLPLYDGVESLEIGVDPGADISLPRNTRLVKSVNSNKKPVIFYGTSITQGGCASRPGMAYPAILGRMMDRETINLGFSGNARLDFAIAKAINMIDAEAVIIDCLPNTTTQMVRDSAYRFITHIALAKPQTPIFMIENPNFPYLLLNETANAEQREENAAWRNLYAQLAGEGFENIIYVRGDNLLGDDNESTVDGVHLTDLGFLRFSEALFGIITDVVPLR
ncbi:MAG TPA: hydrolase [Rikenellaceae bacterium]|nr:hydrolase [Rikenellaceae bacterium]